MKIIKSFGLFFCKVVCVLGMVAVLGWTIMEVSGARIRFGSAYLEDTLTGGVSIGSGRFYAWDSLTAQDIYVKGNVYLGDADEIIWRTSGGLGKVASVFGIMTFNGTHYDFQDITGDESYVQFDSANGVQNNVKVLNNYPVAFDSSVTASATTITPRSSFLVITGSTDITHISTTGMNEGTELFLFFTGNLTVQANEGGTGQIVRTGDFVATPNDFLSVWLYGGNWYGLYGGVNPD